MAAPLKLKQQKSASVYREQVLISKNLPVASVLVETPVSHLEGIYDYLIPQHLNESAMVGSKVLVEFGRGTTGGLLVGRKDKSEQTVRLNQF